MRTLRGMAAFIAESVRLDRAVAKLTPRLMMRVLVMLLVTARVEQIPSICTKTGFSFQRLLTRVVSALDFIALPLSPA